MERPSIQSLRLRKNGAPFAWVAMLWLFAAAIAAGALSHWRGLWSLEGGGLGAWGWLGLSWALSVMNLAILSRVMREALGWMSATLTAERFQHAIQTLLFGGLKLASFGCLAWVIYQGREGLNTPQALALVFGLGTLVVVPLGGGYWWNHRELARNV